MFNSINRISIKVTDFCNLDCVYCHQQRSKKDSSKTFEHYDKLYDFLLTLPLADTVDVLATGGEISIKLDEFMKIQKILHRVSEVKDVSFTMSVVTNGTNLPGIVNLVKRDIMRPDSVTVSWDGIYSYSKSRKGKLPTLSDKTFNDNIKFIVDNGYAESMNITFAITPDTVDYMRDSLDYALDTGLRNFSYYYIHEANYTNPEFIAKFTKALEYFADTFVKTYPFTDKRFRYYNWQNMYSRYLLSDASFTAKTACIKLGNAIHIDVDGSIYPCAFFSDHKSVQIGHVLEGFYEDRLEFFEKGYFSEPSCDHKACKNEHCFECPASNFILHNDMNHRTENICHLFSIEREIFMENIKRIHISDFDIRTFWSVGTTIVESHYTEKLDSGCNLPLTDSRKYLQSDEMLLSNNLEVVQSW